MKEKVKTQDYIREFVSILFIQKKVVVYTFLAVLVITLLVAFLWPPSYSSEARILVKHKKLIRNPEVLEKVALYEPSVTESDVSSEMEILTSVNVIQMTIKKFQEKGEIFRKDLSDSEFRALVAKIKENLKTETTPKSDVFKVTFSWSSPWEAEAILRTHINTYLSYRLDVYAPTDAEVFFQKQVNEFNKKLSSLEQELADLASKTASPVADEKIKSNLLIQQSLEADLNKMLNNYVEKKNFVTYVDGLLRAGDVNCFSFVESPNIGDFGKKLQDLLVEREKIKRVYTDGSPPVRAITDQIQATAKALKEEVKRYVEGERAKLKAMEEAIQSMSDRLNKIRNENVKLYNTSLRSKSLERQLKVAEDSFVTFMKRWDEARIDRSSAASNLFTVSVISEAKANLRPVFPDKRVVLPVGLVLSIILGITVGFLLEFFDHTFKRPEDTERYAGLQTIFSIPKF
jgi:uncharacterized protein involved in exopolysaccharide biosynthesis